MKKMNSIQILLNTFRFPTDVEIAARFVLTKKKQKGAAADSVEVLLGKAKEVYITGMQKFPDSPTVLQAYLKKLLNISL